MIPRLLILLLLAIGSAGCTPPEPPAPSLTVYAAASLTDVLAAVGDRYEQATGIEVVGHFAASSTLARQIRAGAAPDVYIAADARWMDELALRGDLREETRRDLLSNRLVLVAPRGAALRAPARSDVDPVAAGIRSLAIGDPDHVPAGRYAMQALAALGWDEPLAQRTVPAIDVRAALRLAEMREVDAAIVYATDAAASSRVTVVSEIDPSRHETIRYPVAAVAGAGPAADAFLEYLGSAEARDVFVRAGFIVLESNRP